MPRNEDVAMRKCNYKEIQQNCQQHLQKLAPQKNPERALKAGTQLKT